RLSGVAGNHAEPQRAAAPKPKPKPAPIAVYELVARAADGVEAGRAWIAPASGSWRVQEGDTTAVAHNAAFERTDPSGTYLRRGRGGSARATARRRSSTARRRKRTTASP